MGAPRSQASTPAIVVVGSVNMDLVFNCARLPAPGETLCAGGFRQVPGGKGGNQAVAAAREGGRVTMIGHVGQDAIGAQLKAALAADGIGVDHLQQVDGAASGVAAIVVDGQGQNSIVVAAGANDCLRPATVRALGATIGAADLLVCQLENPLDAVREAIAIASDGGARVVFNPAPVQRAVLEGGLLERVDYLVVNETEAGELSGIAVRDQASAREAAAWLRRAGARAVLLTMGGEGVWLDGPEGALPLPAIPVRAVDTTAAGDTFVGSFAVALGRGATMLEAAGRARYAAALAVTRAGAQSSIPLRAEVDLFIQRGQAGADQEGAP